MRGLGELLLSNTRFNSFVDIANEYLGPFGGFVIGWTYWFCWIASSMSDLTAIGQYISYWLPDVPNWISVLFVVLILISFNLLGAKLFGELEFWFALIKIITIIALIVVGLVLIFMSVKTEHGTASFSNLVSHGGLFPNGAFGFLMAFQMAIYSFIGIELIGVTAGETKDRANTIPKAINNVPIRILLFYVGSLIIITSVVPWNTLSENSSPFVKVFGLIGIPFAASLVNFVVITAAASATNSGIYSNSRILFGLAEQGLGPKALGKVNHRGVPHISMLISSILLLFAALLNYVFPNAVQLFIYVTTLSTVLYLFVWTLIIISYIIYAFKNKQEHKTNDFKLPGGPYAGIVVLLFFLFAYVLLFFTEETRNALFVSPIWFIIVIIFYQKYKHNAHANVAKMRETKE